MPFGEENAKVLAFAASLAKELGLKVEVLENKVAVIDLNEHPLPASSHRTRQPFRDPMSDNSTRKAYAWLWSCRLH